MAVIMSSACVGDWSGQKKKKKLTHTLIIGPKGVMGEVYGERTAYNPSHRFIHYSGRRSRRWTAAAAVCGAVVLSFRIIYYYYYQFSGRTNIVKWSFSLSLTLSKRV